MGAVDGSRTYEAQIAEQRLVIDEVDAAMVELINRRAAAALQIGAIKSEHGLPIYVGSREQQVYARIESLNEGGNVPQQEMRGVFEVILQTSRAAQQRLQDGQQ